MFPTEDMKCKASLLLEAETSKKKPADGVLEKGQDNLDHESYIIHIKIF